jgi:hypothetical protein
VRRGVPHCAVCGASLVWIPGRAWCLEPSRLPPERRADYARLLSRAPPLDKIEVAPWPVSGSTRRNDPDTVTLLECSRCDRLDALDGPVRCPCGGQRYPVQRRLVPSIAGALAAWARFDPFPVGPTVRLYIGERRRVPAFVHQLLASVTIEQDLSEIGLAILPTVADDAIGDPISSYGADAVRCAFARVSGTRRLPGPIAERCRAERERLARLWSVVGEVVSATDASTRASFAQPIVGFLGELEPEDRALLARWERDRVRALADFERYEPGSVLRRLARFFDSDLAAYREWTVARVALPGFPPSKRAALRTLSHVLRQFAATLAPIAPHVAEMIGRRLTGGRMSVFESPVAPADRSLLSDDLDAAWKRWTGVLRAIANFRRTVGPLAPGTLPKVVLVAPDDALGDQLRGDRAILERLGHIGRIEVGSPREPWAGRQGKVRPIESEIQRLYPSQAAQVSHVLARTPPRSLRGPGATGDVTVVIQGMHLKILPSMVEYVESLPTGFVPHPWTSGEMFIELAKEGGTPTHVPPPMSQDGFWLLRRLGQRVGRVPKGLRSAPLVAIVSATDPLASELRTQAEPLARYLGLDELKVASEGPAPPDPTLTGRTRTGARWSVEVPGILPLPPRTKHPSPRARSRRVPDPASVARPIPVDYSDDEIVGHWESVRAVGAELDALLEAPLLGPTKVAAAWEAGLESVEAYRAAEFEQLVALPGFGRAIATRLMEKMGRYPPASAGPLRVRHPVPAARRPPRAGGPTAAVAESTAVAPSNFGLSPRDPGGVPPAAPSRASVGEIRLDSEVPLQTQSEIGPTGPSEPGDPAPYSDPSPGVERPLEPGGRDPVADVVPDSEGVPDPVADVDPALERIRDPLADVDSGTGELFAESGGPTTRETSGATPEPVLLVSPVEPGGSGADPGEPNGEHTVESAEPDSSGSSAEPGEPEGGGIPGAETAEGSGPTSPLGDFAGGADEPLGPHAPDEDGPLDDDPEGPRAADRVESDPETPDPAPPPDLGETMDRPAGTEVGGMNPPAEPTPVSIATPVAADALESASPPAAGDSPSADPGTDPTAAPEVSAPVPSPSGIELVVGASPFTSIQPFLDATAAGHRGLCLVRESPERVSAQVRPRPVDVYWLTNLGRGKTVRPSDLPGIFDLLSRAISDEHVTALFVEGVEYLVRIHGIEEILGRIAQLDDEAHRHDARIWVHLTPDLLRPADLDRIVLSFGTSEST